MAKAKKKCSQGQTSVRVRCILVCDTEELNLKAYDSVGSLNEDHNECTWEYTIEMKRKKLRAMKQRMLVW